MTPRASLQSDANNNIKWKWEIQGSLPFSGLRLAAITSPRIYRTALPSPTYQIKANIIVILNQSWASGNSRWFGSIVVSDGSIDKTLAAGKSFAINEDEGSATLTDDDCSAWSTQTIGYTC